VPACTIIVSIYIYVFGIAVTISMLVKKINFNHSLKEASNLLAIF